MAEIAIGRAYPIIVREEKLDVLGRPEVRITKIAAGNPLECTVISTVFPEVKLPDYKKLAANETKGTEEITVSDEELEKTITEIRRMRAQQQEGEELSSTPEDAAAGEEKALPVLDDAYVKTLGDFATVKDFTDKLRENLFKEKTRAAKDKKRIAIMDAIVNAAEVELPEIITMQELARMEDEFAHEIERMGLGLDAYLQAVKKSIEDMRKEWRPDAIKRAKVQLIIAKIAEIETIAPDKETLVHESEMLQARHPDAPAERVASFVTMMLTNEKVFQFLEGAARLPRQGAAQTQSPWPSSRCPARRRHARSQTSSRCAPCPTALRPKSAGCRTSW
jgi:FKBP-type peptidyl-prolyl cis-trans isomerase (trigger factor)